MSSRFYRDLDHEWVRLQSFTDTSVEEIFSRVKAEAELRDPGHPPAWVFDLDSTLFCVGPRIKAIFAAFLREHPSPPQVWQRVLPFLDPATQEYSIEGSFRKAFARFDNVRSRELAADAWEAFRDYWNLHFFSDRYLHHDLAYPGSQSFVQRVADAGFEVVYLTGRDRPRTAAGTYGALRHSGYLMDHRCHVLMKPDRETSDVDFKRHACSVLRSRFHPVVFLDNEPENLVMFAREFPTADIVFFHSVMSGRVPLEDYSQVLSGRKAWRVHGFE